MRVVFSLDGIEHLGEARELSTCGAFVKSDQQELPTRLELHLGAEGNALVVSCDVVRVTPEGFAVAFEALGPEKVVRLDKLLHRQDEAPTEEPQSEEKPKPGGIQVQIGDWVPPVSEPTLHQWKPEAELVPPPPGKPQAAAWEGLPTISPEVTIEAPPPPAAPALPAPQATPPEPTPPAAAAQPATAARPEEPSGIERRRYERFDQSIPVVFDTLTSLIKEFTHNISFGGFFVYTTKPMKKGEDIAVTLVHPIHGERLTLLAKVAHAGSAPTPDPVSGEQRYGIGVEFRLPLPELKRLLSEFISSHQKQQASGEAARIMQEARAIMERGAQSQYDLLGVDTEAPLETIRRAYFQLVDRFHPDRFFDKVSKADRKLLEGLFRALTKAYEELTT